MEWHFFPPLEVASREWVPCLSCSCRWQSIIGLAFCLLQVTELLRNERKLNIWEEKILESWRGGRFARWKGFLGGRFSDPSSQAISSNSYSLVNSVYAHPGSHLMAFRICRHTEMAQQNTWTLSQVLDNNDDNDDDDASQFHSNLVPSEMPYNNYFSLLLLLFETDLILRAGLKLRMQLRLLLNSWSSCVHISNSGIVTCQV